MNNRQKQIRAAIAAVAFLAILTVAGIVYREFISTGKYLRYVFEKIELDGYFLAVRELGKHNELTVVIEPGLACSMDLYRQLEYDLSKYYHVISYDHAGIGRSEPNDNPRLLPYYVKEFEELMSKMEVDPPYVLIGHSLGGHIIRYYTYLHPGNVKALVFIDHPPEDWFDYIRSTWTPEEVNEYFRFWSNEIFHWTGTREEELLSYEENCEILKGVEIPENIPALMFTGNNAAHFRQKGAAEIEEDKRAYKGMSYDIIRNQNEAVQIVDWDAGHIFHNDKPELTKDEIVKFINGLP
jgi:hypothetical protein